MNNKVISFERRRKSNKRYDFIATISISFLCNGNNMYFYDYTYPDEMCKTDALKILYNVYLRAYKETSKKKIKIKECLNTRFSISYYESENDFRFIINPNINKDYL